MDFLFLPQVEFTTIAIASSLFAAFANIFARLLLRDVELKDTFVLNFVLMGLVLLILSPSFYRFEANLLAMSLIIGIACIDTFANYFYFKTFEQTEASIATPILSLAPAFTFLFSYIFIGDTVDLHTLIIAGCIILIIVIFSFRRSDLSKIHTHALLPGIIASILFGISAVPTKYLLDTINIINAPTLYMFRAGYIALIGLMIFNVPLQKLHISHFRILFSRGILVIAQWVLLYYALSLGSAGVTMTLGNITPIFVFFLSMILLKERGSLKKFALALLVLILSYFIL